MMRRGSRPRVAEANLPCLSYRPGGLAGMLSVATLGGPNCRRAAMKTGWRNQATRVGYVLLAAGVLANSGCLVVAAGAALGGAAGYAYYKGNVCRTYPARFEDVLAATRSSLNELGMPLLSEVSVSGGMELESRSHKGDS